MDQLAAVGSDALSRATGFAMALCLIATLEFVLPSRARYAAVARIKGFCFWMIFAFAATATFAALHGLWVMLGVAPVFELKFGEWFGWAGLAAAPLAWMSALLVADLFTYWYHRLQHTLLWPFHAVHHSIEELHGVNSYGHVADEFFQFIFMAAPMSLVPMTRGADPVILTMLMILHPYYQHSPLKLGFGPLRRLFADNHFHRIHHSLEPRHFGKNYGITTTVWDQLFGTAYFPGRDEWPATGLAAAREPRSLGEWLAFPFKFRSSQGAAVAPSSSPVR